MNRQTKPILFASLLFLSTGHFTKASELEGFESSKTISETNKEVLSSKQFRSSWFSRGRSEKFDQSALDEIEISLRNEPNTNSTKDSSGNPALNYLAGLMPSIDGSSQNVLSNKIFSAGKSLLVDGGYQLASSYVNEKIQNIPFFAQTSISLSAGTESETNFSFDSLMKLKELGNDDDGDLKGIVFSQGRFATSSDSDGSTVNLGLGFRHRPDDHSMWGGNTFLDYRMTDYSTAHSRLGIGGEYFWKDLEFRNNWYLAITDKKNVTIKGNSYTERVVPGWDAEAGYRLPEKPELAFFVRGFNWDYKDTDDNSGLEGSINWQATPNLNLEAWVSNEIAANDTKVNSQLPGTDETFYGLRFRLTAQPVKFLKKDTKANLISQMTQPVRRKYDVLLERSSGTFINRARGI